MDGQKIHLRNVTKPNLQAYLKSRHFPAFRADQILHWIFAKNVSSFEEMRNLPKDLIADLKEHTVLGRLCLVSTHESSNHESVKFLTRTDDGHLCESVLITQSKRETICVSTQLGCKMGCIFCASGKGKFGRNLTAGEIVEQISLMQRHRKKPVTNVVFMGMGEPLDNYDEVMKSIEILQADWGFGLGARRITVSTSGITPKIVEFVKRSEGRVRLSISLHSSQDAKRTELVPINKKYNLPELIQTLNELHTKLKREITFEYTLLDGVNDSKEEAMGVAKIARRLGAKVNIIPYNPIADMEFKTPSQQKIELFRSVLEKNGIRVIVRQTAGRDINAACGQLRRLRETPAV